MNISEVFCEVLSGLAIMFGAVGALDLFAVVPMAEICAFAQSNFNLTGLTALVVASYILGLIMDGIGLTIGDWFLDELLIQTPPTENQQQKFWAEVNEHVLNYRDHQWAYISTYRNLSIIFIPTGIVWTIRTFSVGGCAWGIVVAISFIIVEIAMIIAAKSLLKLYYEITKSVAG